MANDSPTTQWPGQVRVGWLSTKGFFANEMLTVSEAQLCITSRLGYFCFSPQTVERIERAGFIPWFWTGIRIHHRVSGYPRRLGFWPRKVSTRVLLQELARRGYRTT